MFQGMGASSGPSGSGRILVIILVVSAAIAALFLIVK
jgi:hypothetical protein